MGWCHVAAISIWQRNITTTTKYPTIGADLRTVGQPERANADTECGERLFLCWQTPKSSSLSSLSGIGGGGRYRLAVDRDPPLDAVELWELGRFGSGGGVGDDCGCGDGLGATTSGSRHGGDLSSAKSGEWFWRGFGCGWHVTKLCVRTKWDSLVPVSTSPWSANGRWPEISDGDSLWSFSVMASLSFSDRTSPGEMAIDERSNVRSLPGRLCTCQNTHHFFHILMILLLLLIIIRDL